MSILYFKSCESSPWDSVLSACEVCKLVINGSLIIHFQAISYTVVKTFLTSAWEKVKHRFSET